MADIRSVTFIPKDGEPYQGHVNFDKVIYAEDHGLDYCGMGNKKVPVALLVFESDLTLRIAAAPLDQKS